MISKGASSGIVITDQQLNGKGQRGRKWVFQGGKSVAFSFFSDWKSEEIFYYRVWNNRVLRISFDAFLQKHRHLPRQI